MGNIKYVLMAISICLSVFSSCLLRSFSNKKLASNSGDLFLFNAALRVVWAVVLGIWYLASSDSGASPMAFAFGAAYGVIMCAFLFTNTSSLGEGPVSLTTLIGSCAFIIATWFGVIYANEPSINAVQYIGMTLLIVSLILCINPKKSGEKLTLKWFAYAFAFFIAGGFLGIINKMFGKSDVSTEVNAKSAIARDDVMMPASYDERPSFVSRRSRRASGSSGNPFLYASISSSVVIIGGKSGSGM